MLILINIMLMMMLVAIYDLVHLDSRLSGYDQGLLTFELYSHWCYFNPGKVVIFQAAKSLIYFFAEQKNVIYTVIFFSIFRFTPVMMMVMIIFMKMIMIMITYTVIIM